MVEHALPGSTHMGLLANNIKWMGGFPLYPPKIEKNWKPESHAEEAHCSVHVILFTALSATPSTFNSHFQHPFHLFPLTRSRLKELVVNNACWLQAGSGTGGVRDTSFTHPLNFEILPR